MANFIFAQPLPWTVFEDTGTYEEYIAAFESYPPDSPEGLWYRRLNDQVRTPIINLPRATGQTEAVRSGAGIGILHNYIARQDPELVRVLPATTIRRAYWTTYHESARDLARVRTVTAFVQELVEREQGIFV